MLVKAEIGGSGLDMAVEGDKRMRHVLRVCCVNAFSYGD